MASQNLVEVFNVKKRVVVTPDVTDYEVFPDKENIIWHLAFTFKPPLTRKVFVNLQ